MSFDHPGPPDAYFDPSEGALAATEAANAAAEKRRHLCWSMKTYSSLGAMAGAAAALTLLALESDQLSGIDWPLWVRVAAGSLALATGALLGRIWVSSDAKLLTELRFAIERLTAYEPGTSPLARASTSEVDGVRGAVMNLGRKLLQHRDMQQSQWSKLEEISQIKTNILRMVSHDLRTPLTSIQMYSQILLDDLETISREDQRHFLGIMSEECQRLSRLVDDLLTVQKLESGRMEWPMTEHDIADSIRACARSFLPLAQKAEVEFVVKCPDRLPPTLVVPDKLVQVIDNLLWNALKYAADGKIIALSAQVQNQEILICVRDRGPGIPREKWDSIFDRFTQLSTGRNRDFSGVGLGLHIVKKIVEHHSGRVWVTSEPGSGAEFTVALPIRSSGETEGSRVQLTGAGRALVCEADPELAAVVAQALRELGYEASVTHTGRGLLDYLAHSPPDLVWTDTVFSDASTAELFKGLDKLRPLPFVFIVHSYEGDYAELNALGVDILLRRPATRQDMQRTLRIATQKRENDKPLTLLFHKEATDVEKLTQVLEAREHIVLATSSSIEFSCWLQTYPFDHVVVTSSLLGLGWEALRNLKRELHGRTRLTVLAESAITHRQREWAHAMGVRCVEFKEGSEVDIAAVVTGEPQEVMV